MALSFEYLAAHSARLRQVAALHYGEWPWPELGDSLDAREKLLSTCCRRGDIPLGMIALDGEELCGFALLVPQDFELRPNLSPWLAGVFVCPQHRMRGIGSALVTRIELEAKALGFETLYLYTGAVRIVIRAAWLEGSRTLFHNNCDIAVMAKKLSPAP
jgi:GNAT superfamily N-acetyltransferase